MQGIYSASKHAVLGYTDALRMELEHDRLPIVVTLVKPSAINTPFVEHARNYMDKGPALPPPVYAPEVVADAILRCAERGSARSPLAVAGGDGGHGQADAADDGQYMEQTMFEQQKDSTGTVISRTACTSRRKTGMHRARIAGM